MVSDGLLEKCVANKVRKKWNVLLHASASFIVVFVEEVSWESSRKTHFCQHLQFLSSWFACCCAKKNCIEFASSLLMSWYPKQPVQNRCLVKHNHFRPFPIPRHPRTSWQGIWTRKICLKHRTSGDVWMSRVCKELVHHPIDSQPPIISGQIIATSHDLTSKGS